jgi:hypothetical protein
MTSWVAVIMVCMGTEISQCNVAVYPTSYYSLSDCQNKVSQGFRMAASAGMLVSGSCSQVKIEGTDS